MADFKIQTAQNVTINQNLAGVGQRILALILDNFFLVLFYILVFVLLYNSGLANLMSSWAFVSVLMLPRFLYFPILQYWNNGKTIGKQIVKIKVVKIDNTHPRLGDFIIRWVFRLFEVDAFGAIALIAALVNEKKQRLGDVVAKTTVVSESKKQKLTDSIFEDIDLDYQPLFPQVQTFKEKDVQLIKMVFLDAKKNRRKDILSELSSKIESILHIERSKEMNYIVFIDTILKDYNYYAGRL